VRVLKAEYLRSAGRPEQFPRTPFPEIAFAGRSNVGKSSMINRLLERRQLARVGATPGRTQTINFDQVNDRFLLVDLPGYGYARVSRAVQEAWWELVERYLGAREQLRGVVHIVDARHAPTPLDVELQRFLRAVEVPVLVALTKADKVGRGERAAVRAAAVTALGLPGPEAVLFFSAETGEGAPELWREIESRLLAAARTGAPPQTPRRPRERPRDKR
jgi:GTP-binding protein